MYGLPIFSHFATLPGLSRPHPKCRTASLSKSRKIDSCRSSLFKKKFNSRRTVPALVKHIRFCVRGEAKRTLLSIQGVTKPIRSSTSNLRKKSSINSSKSESPRAGLTVFSVSLSEHSAAGKLNDAFPFTFTP
jgi:hypothetical protein